MILLFSCAKRKSYCKATITSLFIAASLLVNAQSPTAPALDFNVFLKNGARLVTNETEGPVAMGGDMTLAGNYRVAIKNVGTFKVSNVSIGLVVGGKMAFVSGNQTYVNNGYVKIGNATGSKVWYKDNNNANSNLRVTNGNYDAQPSLNLQTSAANLGVSATNNPVYEGNLIDFTTAFSAMQANATNMAAYATNIEFTNPNGDKKGSTIPSVLTGGQIKVNLKTGVNVMNVTGSELNSVTGNITFNTTPNATRILVINVNAPGTFNWSVWNQAGLSLSNCPYIIYNFYNTTNLQIQGNSTIEGTVFAPFADITKTVNQSNIEGQVIGLSYYQSGGENHYANFTPTLPNTNVPLVSVPTVGATQTVCTNNAIRSVRVGWTNGNGASRLVIAQKASQPGLPTDGQSYTANSAFGSGSAIGSGYVVYNGTGSSVTITNLEANTAYYFSVIEYNINGSAIAYASSLKSVINSTTLADTDGDGVPDNEDQYPNDASKAFNNMYPASGFSTLMFEDQWPYKGDYDFNDLVIDYKINTITSASNNIAEMEFSFVPKAAGATFKDGFAFQLDGIVPGKIVSVTGTKMTSGWTTLNANGTEAGHASHANIIVFDNAFNTFNNLPSGGTLVNTFVAAAHYSSDTIKVVVKFQANAVSFSSTTSTQFNPYIIVNQTRGREVHLTDRMPSAKMDISYFGKGDDNSNVNNGKYYKTKNNLPWALNIVSSIPHAQEQVDFTSGYLNFIKWAASQGVNNKDWYLNTPANRQDSKLYTK